MPPVDPPGAFAVLAPARVNVVKPLTPPAHSPLDPKFSRALDYRLRRLQEKRALEAARRRPARRRLAASEPDVRRAARPALSRSHPRLDLPRMEPGPSPGRAGDKPRFVTTVKSGQFLLPPPELARVLGLEALYPPQGRDKLVYSYASRPKAVTSRAKRAAPDRAGAAPPPAPEPRPRAGQVFGGVRALIAGVAGMTRALEQHDQQQPLPNGSMPQYANMMHDKRVVRGSTVAQHPQAAGDGLESAAARLARTRRRALARRAAAARLRPGTPPPAPGRRHHPIQTEYYLEELFDKGVEFEVGVQTDLFVDRPATPIYVPAKTGADASTQIYPGDLFDFDLEVQPILEVLVGKTSSQALAEVAQEEELCALREQQRRYLELRDAERAERERLAMQDRRLNEEKERRVVEARAAQAAAREARGRVAAAVLVTGYVAELLPAVLASLREQGYLMDRIQRGVDEEFMPWLVSEVSSEIESIITSRDVMIEIVREVVESRYEQYRGAGEAEAAREPPVESITPTEYGEELSE